MRDGVKGAISKGAVELGGPQRPSPPATKSWQAKKFPAVEKKSTPMFARVFDTAKRILSRSPSVQAGSSEPKDTPPAAAPDADADATMVTTRGGTDTPGATATPRSSAKKRVGKRELESLDTPTQVKRQRKTTLTKKKVAEDAPEAELSTEDSLQESVGEAVPTSDAPSKEGDLPIRRRTSPKVVIDKLSPPASSVKEVAEGTKQEDASMPTQDAPYETPEHQPSSVYATPATQKIIKEGSPTPKAIVSTDRIPASAKKSRGRPKKAQKDDGPKSLEVTETTTTFLDEIPSSTYESEQASIPSQNGAAASPQTKTAHMRFGSEEPIGTRDTVIINQQGHERYKAPEGQPEPAQDEDDASDSDEAPEVVTAAAATSKANLAQQEANRALQAQQAAQQAKRQKREDRIAEEQAQKRIREEAKAKKLARKLAKEQKNAAQPYADGVDALQPRINVDMSSLPALLPDSLLEAIDSQRPPTPPPQRRGKTEEELRKEKLNHHIKFLERTEKPAKDVKKGKLSVAVLGQQNRVLPPKANRDTRNVREHWLKGRKVEKKKKGGKPHHKFGKMERRAHGVSGFLRGED